MAAFGVAVGARLSVPGPALSDPHVWAAMLAAIALTITANAWNDAQDADIDRRAGSTRPVASGAIAVTSAREIALGSAVAGLLFAIIAAPALGLVTVGVVAAMIAYTPWIKRIGLAGNATVAVLASLPFLYGGWSHGNALSGLALSAAAMPLHFAREIAKDIDDVQADAGARRTLPMMIGVPRTRWVVVGILIGTVGVLFAISELVREVRYWLLPTLGVLAVAIDLILQGHRGGSTALKTAMLLAMCTFWSFALLKSP